MINLPTPASEYYERYYSQYLEDWRVQYCYTTPAGTRFRCMAKTLETARLRRDEWIKTRMVTRKLMRPIQGKKYFNHCKDCNHGWLSARKPKSCTKCGLTTKIMQEKP